MDRSNNSARKPQPAAVGGVSQGGGFWGNGGKGGAVSGVDEGDDDSDSDSEGEKHLTSRRRGEEGRDGAGGVGGGGVGGRRMPPQVPTSARLGETHLGGAAERIRGGTSEGVRDGRGGGGGVEGEFLACKVFSGSRRGYVFKLGDLGLGYYRDRPLHLLGEHIDTYVPSPEREKGRGGRAGGGGRRETDGSAQSSATPTIGSDEEDVDSDSSNEGGNASKNGQSGPVLMAQKKQGFLDKMAGLAVKQLVKHSTPDTWNEKDWAKAEALHRDPKTKIELEKAGKKGKLDPDDLIDKDQKRASQKKSKKKVKESDDEDTPSDDEETFQQDLERRGIKDASASQKRNQQGAKKRSKGHNSSSDEEEQEEEAVRKQTGGSRTKADSRLCTTGSLFGGGRLTGLCTGASAGHESEEEEEEEDRSSAASNSQDSEDEQDAAARRKRAKALKRKLQVQQRLSSNHEGRKSAASLPGWGETISSMNWSLASQKLKEETSRARANLTIKVVEGIDKLHKDTETLQKRAADFTKDLYTSRDNTMPMYRGDDPDSD